MAGNAASASIWNVTATGTDEQSSDIDGYSMGLNTELCCPDGRVGFEASRGFSHPCVFFWKKGPSLLFPGQQSLQGHWKNGGDRPESGGDFFKPFTAISSRVG